MERLLVVVEGDPRFFGKLTDAADGKLTIEFFNGVGNRTTAEFPRAEVDHAFLQNQTRVFHHLSTDRWRVGRVVGAHKLKSGFFEYSVRFPNDVEETLPEQELFVRALTAFSDPAENLADGFSQTKFFADKRLPAISRLIRMRSASEGLTGLVSASVDLVPHQLAIVRKVLEDPIQRYLLADEVGLGKTIEAGAIVRQALIDDPKRFVVILSPPQLVEQWRAEMNGKFHLHEFQRARVEIAEYKHANDIRGLPDLLVIDEAHQISLKSDASDQVGLEYKISELARQVPKLLLLSATPPIGDEDRLFGLVHLLDPVLFPMSERGEFKSKIESRGRIGRLLLSLEPGIEQYPARQAARQVKRLFPTDADIGKVADEILETDQDDASRERSIMSLRNQIAERHRLHRRLLRSRRVDVEKIAMRRRGPVVHDGELPNLSHVRMEWDDSVSTQEACRALESWRLEAHAFVRTNPVARQDLMERCAQLHDALSTGVEFLTHTLSSMRQLFPGEFEIFSAVSAAALSDDQRSRYVAITSAIVDWRKSVHVLGAKLPHKLVCFSSSETDGDRLAAELETHFGLGVVRRVKGASLDIDAINRFEVHKTEWILICDRSGEEGMNLQFAQAIFHLDLPLDLNRLEQRIGRLDRYGRRQNVVTQRVMLPTDDPSSAWWAWFHLLANGFQIFNQSVSDVQFKLQEFQSVVFEKLFDQGGSGLEELTQQIQQSLREERLKLEEQHVFESAIGIDDSPAQVVARIEDEEADQQEMAMDLHPWMTKVIGLEANPFAVSRDSPQTWRFTNNTLVPKLPWKKRMELGLERKSTFWRERATKHQGEVLLRPGSFLIDCLEQFSNWDDRGSSFSIWRSSSKVRRFELVFKLTFVVGPGLATGRDVLNFADDGGLARRAMSIFPPWIETLFLDEDWNVVTDPELLSVLDATQLPGDLNLANRPKTFASAVDPVRFRMLCLGARDAAKSMILGSAEFQRRAESAEELIERDIRGQQEALRYRLRTPEFGRRERSLLECEIELLETVVRMVKQPNLRLDSIGFFALSPHQPTVEG